MKTVIAYYSQHHGNTKKLLDAIAAENDVTLVDVTKKQEADLTGYDRVGFASGIFYGSMTKQVMQFASVNLPAQKDVFLIATCGSARKGYFDSMKKILNEKDCKLLGEYLCLGFDTFGPFKLVGGVSKGHPDEDEIKGAVEFYSNL